MHLKVLKMTFAAKGSSFNRVVLTIRLDVEKWFSSGKKDSNYTKARKLIYTILIWEKWLNFGDKKIATQNHNHLNVCTLIW